MQCDHILQSDRLGRGVCKVPSPSFHALYLARGGWGREKDLFVSVCVHIAVFVEVSIEKHPNL